MKSIAAALIAGAVFTTSVSTVGAATIEGTTTLPIAYDTALTFRGTGEPPFVLDGDEFADQGVLFGPNWRINSGPDRHLSVVDKQVQPGNIYFLQPVSAAVIRSQSTPSGTAILSRSSIGSPIPSGCILVSKTFFSTNCGSFGRTGILTQALR